MAWTNAARTPNLYPDAITLSPMANIDSLLSEIDQSVGCSIKDSFAALDLHPYGFTILFEAIWVELTAGANQSKRVDAEVTWKRVTSTAEFQEWLSIWHTTNDSDALNSGLLNNPEVDFIGAYKNGNVLGGAIANRSEQVTGLSNFFAHGNETPGVFGGCVDHVRALSPSCPVVSYLANSSLRLLKASSFRVLGPLRVWIK